MNISQVSKLTGLSTKSIRFYESKDVINLPLRGENGYRYYSEEIVEQLKLVARARMVGFSLDECKSLVELANDPSRHSCDVKATAKQKLVEVREKLSQLHQIEKQLTQWVNECPGDNNPDCPIIDNLKGNQK